MSLYPTPAPSQLVTIPSGVDGIRATLRKMVSIVKTARTNPAYRQLAASLFSQANLASGDFLGEIQVLHAFVRDQIRYMGDINEVETLQTPDATLKIAAGDCDDKCTLLATLQEATNHPTRFVALGFNGNGYSHVICETRLKNRWIPEETCKMVDVDWYPPNVTRRMVAHI